MGSGSRVRESILFWGCGSRAHHPERGRHPISTCQSLIMSQRLTFTFFFLGEAPQLPNMVIKVPAPFSRVRSERLDFSYTLV